MNQVLNKYEVDKSLETENTKEKYIGRVFQSNSCGEFKVLGVHSKTKKYSRIFVIEFLNTGNQILAGTSAILKGEVKDNFAKTVFGSGYIGNYKGYVKDSGYYEIWQMLLKRCFIKEYQNLHKTYLDCTISDDWLCFDIFQSDCRKLLGFQEKEKYKNFKFQLDKDILYHNNKHYSKENCIWIPQKLNSFFTNINSRNTTGYEGITQTKYGYTAMVSIDATSQYIDCFENLEDAYNAYCKKKSDALEFYINGEFHFLNNKIKDALRNKLLCQQKEKRIKTKNK